MAAPGSSDARPDKLGRYEVRGTLAEGARAHVYVGFLAGSRHVASPLALKAFKAGLSNDQAFFRHLLAQARIAMEMRHPSVVVIHELGEAASRPTGRRVFLALDLVDGESLSDLSAAARSRGERVPEDVVAWIGARVADGLHYGHELRTSKGRPYGLVHQGLNPSNVFVTYDGNVKIFDFGLSKARSAEDRERGLRLVEGKVAYMAPEQIKSHREIDRRTDLFALGVILWELTTDRRLFKRQTSVETLAAVAACHVPDPTGGSLGCSPALWEILCKTLAKSKEERFANAQELAGSLDAFSSSRGRVVDSATVARYMEGLFGARRDRYRDWLELVRSEALPAPPGAFRPPSTGDDDDLLVGDPPASGSVGRAPSPPSEPPPPSAKSARAPLPPPPPPLSAQEAFLDNRRAWMWGLVLLGLGALTLLWVIRHV